MRFNAELAACVPCDPASVPWFDRWAIGPPRDGWNDASTVAVIGVGLATLWDLGGHWLSSHPTARNTAAMELAHLGESAALAIGVTELVKALADRNRPGLYTVAAAEVAESIDAQRSWPSGHTATAFALATGYVLALRDRKVPVAPWRIWLPFTAAAGIGVMRVAAGQHFPSDVVAGAAVGVLSALLVHNFQF